MRIVDTLSESGTVVRPDWATTPARHFPGPDGFVLVPDGSVLDYWTQDGQMVSPDDAGRIQVPAGHRLVHSRRRGEGPPPPAYNPF